MGKEAAQTRAGSVRCADPAGVHARAGAGQERQDEWNGSNSSANAWLHC